MREYPLPPYGVLPFKDPIARGLVFNGTYYTFAVTSWREHDRFARALKRLRRKHKEA